jgi:uncharacterized membrane protein YgdD (TMEM256/DUF423 family)
MSIQHIVQTAALLGALAVGLGAFGAHGLGDVLQAQGRSDTFETAVKYHFYHSLAALICASIALRFPAISQWRQAALFFFAGIFIFSGSLYVLSLTGITWLGAITPLGGVAFILGWCWIAWGASQLDQ